MIKKNFLLIVGFQALYGQHLFDDHILLDHRLELVVYQVNRIQLPGQIVIDNAPGNFLGVLEINAAHDVDVFMPDGPGTVSKPVRSLSTHQRQADGFIDVFFPDVAGSRLDDVCAKSTTQSSVGCDHHQHRLVAIPLHQQRVEFRIGASGQ